MKVIPTFLRLFRVPLKIDKDSGGIKKVVLNTTHRMSGGV